MDKKLRNYNNFGFGAIGILIALVILIIFIGGGFFAYQYFQIKNLWKQEGQDAMQETPASVPSPQPSTTEIDISSWKTYRNETYGFEVKYPSSWLQWTDDDKFPDGPWVFASVPEDKKVHGLGIPPSGEMQVLVAYGLCNNATAEFIAEDYGRGAVVLERTSCTLDRLQKYFQISTLLWDADPNKENHKELLESIGGTFRITK